MSRLRLHTEGRLKKEKVTAHGAAARAGGELQTRNLKHTVYNRPRTRSGPPFGPRAADRRPGAIRIPSAQPRLPQVWGPSSRLRAHVELQPLTRSELDPGRLPTVGHCDPEGRFRHQPRRPEPPVRCRRRPAALRLRPLESLGYPTASPASCIRSIITWKQRS